MWPRDVNDVTHRKRGLRFEKCQLVEIETWARTDEFVCYRRRTCWWGADGKVSIERWYLSLYVEKPFNSKVIKSFVPELRSRKCFSCFGIPMFYGYMLWTFHVRFTYSCMAMLQPEFKSKPTLHFTQRLGKCMNSPILTTAMDKCSSRSSSWGWPEGPFFNSYYTEM